MPLSYTFTYDLIAGEWVPILFDLPLNPQQAAAAAAAEQARKQRVRKSHMG